MNPGDRYQPVPYGRLNHPAWSKKATIYQINRGQFAPAGTFCAAAAHLPRLQALGVDIVWLMPVHAIGQVNRKGTLDNPYAVRDYYSVNPEFSTLDDLRQYMTDAMKYWVREGDVYREGAEVDAATARTLPSWGHLILVK